MPNDPGFSTAQTTPLIITAVGQSTMILKWAKQQISNGDPSKFAYLGQYFDPTGVSGAILSEYGDFFPTQPGQFTLKTKADISTAQQGQCTVYAVSLNVDANHDGFMDLRYGGVDTTSAGVPMKFWVNNDNDGTDVGQDKEVFGTKTPPDYTFGTIRSQRNLEDFARLWICGVPALTAEYTVILSCDSLSASPAINLYSAEPGGGIAYLNDPAAAANLAAQTKLATISPGNAYTVPNWFFDGANKYFLFEGAGIGSGRFTLSIWKGNTLIAQNSAWIELNDVDRLFEQAHVANVVTTFPAMIGTRPLSTVVPDRSWNPDPAEAKQLIVYVHGWRMKLWDYYNFSESMFKRLYWQGYQGRFASLRWPTLSAETEPLGKASQFLTFNRSEHIAFDSANGAAQYFVWLRSRFPDYSINVAAHSQGNIVMMEALKQMLSLGVSSIDNYVLMQAAVPAQSYDLNAPNFPLFISDESSVATPNTYLGYPGSINNALRLGGKMVNFFNPFDFAVGQAWVANEHLQKPEGDLGYYVNASAQPYRLPSTLVTDPREVMAFVARPRSQGLGVQGGVQGIILGGEVNLNTSFGFGGAASDHSAEFNRNIQVLGGFYQSLLLNALP